MKTKPLQNPLYHANALQLQHKALGEFPLPLPMYRKKYLPFHP